MKALRLLGLGCVVLCSSLAFAQSSEIYDPTEPLSTKIHAPAPLQDLSTSSTILLNTKGGLITGVGIGAGGADESQLQGNLGLNTIGFSSNAGFRLAQKFTVPAGGWAIDKVTVYAYQTGSTTTSTFTGLNLRVWNGSPAISGSAVVFGDTTTNRMTSTAFSNIYRVTNTTSGATNRPIMAIDAGNLGMFLPAGTYWLDFQLSGSLGTGPFVPPLSTIGQTGVGVAGDLVQLVISTGIWSNVADGALTTAPQTVALTLVGAAPGVTLTETAGSTAVTEGGATDTFTAVLQSAPTSDVTITLTPNAQVSVSPTTLTFTSSNWSTPQTVTVTAVDDFVAEGAHTGSVAFSLASADTNYNGLVVAPLTVNITDNDSAGVTIVESAGSTNVAEGGATDTLTFVLTSQPVANVTVTLSPNSQVATSPATLTFTPANWNVTQTVTVSAVDDFVAEGAHTGSIAFTTASSDGNYNALTLPGVTVNITDNDTAGITVTRSGGSAVYVAEGGATGTFTLVLTSQPTANVVFAINAGTQVSTSPAAVTFTPANWNVPQAVTVTAVDDNVIEGFHLSSISLTVTSTDTNYNNRVVAPISVAITDNDYQPVPTLDARMLLALLALLVGSGALISRQRG